MSTRIRMTQAAIDAANAKHEQRRREAEEYQPEDYIDRARWAQDNDRADYYRDPYDDLSY